MGLKQCNKNVFAILMFITETVVICLAITASKRPWPSQPYWSCSRMTTLQALRLHQPMPHHRLSSQASDCYITWCGCWTPIQGLWVLAVQCSPPGTQHVCFTGALTRGLICLYGARKLIPSSDPWYCLFTRTFVTGQTIRVQWFLTLNFIVSFFLSFLSSPDS